MQLRNSANRFGAIAGMLHWTIVAGVIAQYFLAEAAEESKTQTGILDATSLHRSIGFTILFLAIVRLVWRFIDPPPRWPPAMGSTARLIAKATHALFYALLVAVPLTGWAVTSAEGDPLSVFGLFAMPSLPVGEALEHTLEEAHEVLFNILAALALVHVVAALKHQFVDRDGLMGRMLPGRD